MRGISDNVNGVILAISSSIFIGSSFIIKKKGLKKASATGTRAGSGGHSYLLEPMWWAGMLTMIVGEGANFAAYAYAPAILVTPLGALSIIVSAVLAHFILKERLHIFGIVGCVLCLVGSVSIVLHAPLERKIESVMDVWYLATEPVTGRGIWSFTSESVLSRGLSRSVMGVKAVGIALKLTFEGKNQFKYFQTWLFTVFVIIFCLLQLNYLNKDWDHQNATQIITELCGFVTILSGTFLLHKTKDMGNSPSTNAILLPKNNDIESKQTSENLKLTDEV
ncbi:hypothetical protein RND71_004842 [Anisodus tanguticus]|uniref:Probable magnesium transporter n=1 Tax=Anisodus tanguticus TaxID=243964 RepID=A0AAE1SQV6_9SOLA|nr:hypothetical protein RND71_004842 [Anisodus tanguticus]